MKKSENSHDDFMEFLEKLLKKKEYVDAWSYFIY